MANIITRETAGTNCTVNNAPLSYSQMDDDLIALNNDIITLQGYYTTGVSKVLNGGTGVTTKTGTGSVVLNTSPTLVTPALGTPTSGNLANCTFPTLNQNTSGSAASLSATLPVNRGGSGVTTSTGSGSVVLNTSPTLVTPALGTPSSGVVTNLTGTASININGTVGLSAQNSAKFTTIDMLGANNTTTGNGQIYLNGTTGNRIDYNTNGLGAPTVTTRSVGTKVCLYPAVNATTVDYAIGIENDYLWNSVPLSTLGFKWYGGTTLAATLSGDGQFILPSASAQSLTDSAIWCNGTSGSIMMDIRGHKRIAWNDAAGNLSIKGGCYHNGTNLVYANDGVIAGGAAVLSMDCDGANGAMLLGVDNMGSAGQVVTYANRINISTTTTQFNGLSHITTIGDIHCYRSAGNTGYIYFGSAGTEYIAFNGITFGGTTAYVVFSDERVKSNIQPISNSLEKVLKLSAKSFIRNCTEREEIGVIAQELLEVLPTAVSKAEGDTTIDANGVEQPNYYGVDYNQITALLIEGMKEQQKIIEELTKRIELLEGTL